MTYPSSFCAFLRVLGVFLSHLGDFFVHFQIFIFKVLFGSSRLEWRYKENNHKASQTMQTWKSVLLTDPVRKSRDHIAALPGRRRVNQVIPGIFERDFRQVAQLSRVQFVLNQ